MGTTPTSQQAPDDPEYVKAHHLARRMSAIADATGDRGDHAKAAEAHEEARRIAESRLTGEQRDRALRRHTSAHAEHQSGAIQNMSVGGPPPSSHQVVMRGTGGERRVEVPGPPPSKPALSYADMALRADQQARRAAILRGIAARKGDSASLANADRADAHAVRLHEQAAAAAPTQMQRQSHESFVAAVRGTPSPRPSADPPRSAAVAATRAQTPAERLAEHARRERSAQVSVSRKAQDHAVARAEALHRGLDQESSYAKRSRAIKALTEDHARRVGSFKARRAASTSFSRAVGSDTSSEVDHGNQ